MTRPSDKKKAAPKPADKAAKPATARGPGARSSRPEPVVEKPPEEEAPPPPPAPELDTSTLNVGDLTDQMLSDSVAGATKAARTLSEVVAKRADLAAPHVERFVRSLTSPNKRVAQTAGEALPAIAKIAPARVAKHLDALRDAFSQTTDDGKEGLVRTWAALCAASVAYQRRLEPCLTLALGEAEPKVLVRWTEIVLPSLKGEPHARARAVVEERLESLPRPQAQAIADFLGIKLRPKRA